MRSGENLINAKLITCVSFHRTFASPSLPRFGHRLPRVLWQPEVRLPAHHRQTERDRGHEVGQQLLRGRGQGLLL